LQGKTIFPFFFILNCIKKFGYVTISWPGFQLTHFYFPSARMSIQAGFAILPDLLPALQCPV